MNKPVNKFEQGRQKKRKGGLITIPFIIANEAFEKVASFGLSSNMTQYLIQDYRMGVTQVQNLLFYWGAITNFLPIVGALVSDSYLGRYLTICFSCICGFLGMTILWLTTLIPQARPAPCDLCKPTSTLQYLILLTSFVLMSIAAGGVRPCSIAFGADQIINKDHPVNRRMLQRFFGWYYAFAAVSIMVAMTVIVYIQDHLGWKVGFGIPAFCMFLSAFLFLLASPFYVKPKVNKNLLSSFLQVIAVSYKNRNLTLASLDSNMWYTLKDSEHNVPTDKLRFMNKACIIRDLEDISSDGVTSNLWNICTIDQVEELKTLIRVLPLWSTGIMMYISPGSFMFLQAESMDRRLIGSFEIPAGSFGMLQIGTIFLWIVLYEQVLLPLASKIRGKRVLLGVKERLGMGLFCGFIAMILSAIVEHKRRTKAIEQGLEDSPNSMINMSAYWLVPPYVMFGLAEALNSLAQTEFFYTEFPKSMSSIASTMFGLGMACGNLLSSALLSIVNNVTSRGGKESWTSSNINKARYDKYYWLLAVMNAGNLLYFLYCSWADGPCVKQRNDVRLDENNGSGSWKEELSQLNKPPGKYDEGENVEETSEPRAALGDHLKLGNGVAHQSENGEEFSKTIVFKA
ncbi:protein NRT1/ PTR FAMILY 1.1-like [Apium graveolens]|uniref:protein NRT1/ PTR FAMILY 1.1-like n=1 Tax=Apium graveolens TaxID=4045 RepID=UPI003D7A2E39